MRAAAARGDTSALVDPGSGFDPDSAAGMGVDLSRLLWLQPPDRGALLRGTELLLETGGFGLVVLDLVGEPKRPLSRIAWARLARRAREGGSVLLALTSAAQARQSAALVLRVTRTRFRWRGKGRPYWDGVELQFAPVRRAAGVS